MNIHSTLKNVVGLPLAVGRQVPRVLAVGVALGLSLTACGGKDEAKVAETTTAPASGTDTSAVDETTTAVPTGASVEELVTAGEMFDRELRSIASYGDSVNNNPNDTDPRKASLLIDMAQNGGIFPDITVTAKGADGQPVVVWQDGALKVAVEALDMAMNHVQLSRGGVDVCVAVSSTANEASTVTQGACPW